ncbi:Ada metal-binding domain-containing protein [Paenibacillus monticola]|uniref:Helix-turn-helix domain-containing protein n=1 Tax=Paenibacillus monticola TaxID=2666075 RepID=A0A7X2HAT5_9BACL|nr:Ada metal-binding domain-containing protein [Paenibacillus monticola]MRN56595.1 helix-turn-helix domain-containing protein [Paenibacillus monticola]
MNQALFDLVYQSVVRRESTYDGVYYTAVLTTHIVCRPSCRARTPNACNVTFYTSLQAALREGFRPCKRCRPEEGGCLRPDAVLAVQADAIMEARYSEHLTLEIIAESLKVSPFHLQKTYKQVTGYSPAVKLDRVRLEKVRQLLKDTDLAISTIGQAVGIRGASHFAAWFMRKTGLTPTGYRTQFKEEANHEPDPHISTYPEHGE